MHKIIPATAPCSWGVWYADGRPSGVPYSIFLDGAARAGYEMLELGPDGYLPADLGRLRAELESRNLSICSGTACYQFDRFSSFADFREQVDSLCKRLASFEAPYLITMDESDVGKYSEKKKEFSPELWRKYFQMFKEMGAYTYGEYGIKTLFHPHIKSLVETEQEICDMIDYTGLDLCFDIGHHAYVNGSGEMGDPSALDFVRRYPARIAYLHFKNVDHAVFEQVRKERLDSDTAFDMDVMGLLDTGIVDYNALRDVLDQINFEGIGVVEQDAPNATAEEAYIMAKHNLNYLKQIQLV